MINDLKQYVRKNTRFLGFEKIKIQFYVSLGIWGFKKIVLNSLFSQSNTPQGAHLNWKCMLFSGHERSGGQTREIKIVVKWNYGGRGCYLKGAGFSIGFKSSSPFKSESSSCAFCRTDAVLLFQAQWLDSR